MRRESLSVSWPERYATRKLHVLGCGGRNQSGYLVQAANRLFLLDCGATTLLAMKRAGFDPRRLEVIILSHLHGDHFGGIPFFFIEHLYLTAGETPLSIAGPDGTEEQGRGLFKIMYGGGANSREIPPARFQVLHPEASAAVDGIEVFPFQVPHQTHDFSLALKVSHKCKQILFSGDSLRIDRFTEQARDVDLFLCECSFHREQPGLHVNYHALEANLSRLECRKLLLTHLAEEMLRRRGELAVAEDGMVIEI